MEDPLEIHVPDIGMTIPGMEGGFTEMCFEIAAAAGRASMRIQTVLRSENLLPTSKEIADLYLYGSSSIPDLTTESVIRENPLATLIPRNVDVEEYMSAGAGRFATGDQFALTSTFCRLSF